MSYDMNIGDDHFNYTYNVSGMWYDCYKEQGIRQHYGMTGNESVAVLRNLREHMENNAERLRLMDPENGWGSFDGALGFVNKLIAGALRNPLDIWEGD